MASIIILTMILIRLLLIFTVCSSHVFLPKVKRIARTRSDHKHAKTFIKLHRGGDADTTFNEG